ncbi:MAG: GNAT family N-acetyltransferase [Alphaproteobacteria bacterium]|jgi:ribosomal-protein-serine acetyltransferase|nr:GNAT family N-acetyltransferase [Alphaproteobacteria bacterium]
MLRKPFRKIIKGERIILRKLDCSEEQAKVLLSKIEKNRQHLLPWIQWVHYNKTYKDNYNFLKGKEEDWANKTDALYGIYLKKELIGVIELRKINYVRDSGELGYWIDSEYAGNGYMTEAVKVIEDIFFNRGLNRMVIKADVDNYASISVAEKNDYTFEGVLRQASYYMEGEGEFRNIAVYSKLYYEWEDNRGDISYE